MKEPTVPGTDRVSDNMSVTLRTAHGGVVQGELREISINGLHVSLKETQQAMGPCHVGLLLKTDKGPLEVQATGSIIRSNEDGVVVHVESVVGVESLEHLRGLILRDPAKARLSGAKRAN